MVVGDSKHHSRFLLLYGTATGQAKAIAEEIAEKASTCGLASDLYELDDIGKKLASLAYQNSCKLPSAASDVFEVAISDAQVLTSPDAVKKTLLLRLSLE
ncbi:methionine synthase reductase, partial [Elysia marginata]